MTASAIFSPLQARTDLNAKLEKEKGASKMAFSLSFSLPWQCLSSCMLRNGTNLSLSRYKELLKHKA